jgi:hypothetical protein
VTIAPSDFVAIFPEFGNGTTYPTAQIQFYLNQAYAMLNPVPWGALQDQGVGYYTAHNLAIAQQRQLSATAGGVPGASQGMTSSKSVDKVSISYDTQAIALENGGLYNQTTYGIQFLTLARMVGSAPTQIVGSCVGVNVNGIGWSGIC